MMRKTIKWFAVISAMVMALALVLAGCSDPSSSSNDSSGNGATAGSSGTDSGLTGGSGSSSGAGNGGETVPEGFVKVKGGTITGSTDYSSSDGDYIFMAGRTVEIKDLYVSDHEVTQKEYETYCKYGGSNPEEPYGLGDNYPAYSVNWYDAVVYCNLRSIDEGLPPAYKIGDETDPRKWSGIVGDAENGYCGPSSTNSTWDAITYDTTADGYRLPTEAEREWLARGGENYIYAGSGTIDDVAWYKSNTNNTGTREVKTKQANGYGLYDMSGNVAEWCWDWYTSSISSSTDAAGAVSGSFRVLRGGSWYSADYFCKVDSLDGKHPYDRITNYGFRVVRNAK